MEAEPTSPMHGLVLPRTAGAADTRGDGPVVSSNSRPTHGDLRPTVLTAHTTDGYYLRRHGTELEPVVRAMVDNRHATDVFRRHVRRLLRQLRCILRGMLVGGLCVTLMFLAVHILLCPGGMVASSQAAVPAASSASQTSACKRSESTFRYLTSFTDTRVSPALSTGLPGSGGNTSSIPDQVPSNSSQAHAWKPSSTRTKKDTSVCCVFHHYYQSLLWLPIRNYFDLADMASQTGRRQRLSCILILRSHPCMVQFGHPPANTLTTATVSASGVRDDLWYGDSRSVHMDYLHWNYFKVGLFLALART